MQFSGSLEDVSIIDVLQILGLTGKDGRLQIQAPPRTAEVMFQAGRVTAASLNPPQTFMTSRLLQRGQIGFETLHLALQRQRELPAEHPRPIGAILVEVGAITKEQLRLALHEHIQTVINEVAGWTLGTFSFELGARSPLDGLGLHPSDLEAQPQVNLQELLLEAARVYDETHHAHEDGDSCGHEDVVVGASGAAEAAVILVSDDLLVQYGIECASHMPTVTIAPSLAGLSGLLQARAAPPKLVVLDLDQAASHNGHISSLTDALRSLLLGDQGASILLFGRAVPTWLLDLMAAHSRVAHVPRPSPTSFRDPGVARLFVEALLARIRRGCEPSAEGGASSVPRDTLQRLYQSVLGLRSSRHSMNVSLELLRYVAGELERAVLLLVQNDQLMALGVFGVADGMGSLDSSHHGRLRVPLRPESILNEVVRTQKLVHHRLGSDVEDAGLDALFERIGRPTLPEAFLVPLVVRDRTFALVYADNGGRDAPLGPAEPVGVLAEHGGQLLENLLLVRQAERRVQRNDVPTAKASAPKAPVEPVAQMEHYDL